MISKHMTSQCFFKNSKNLKKNTSNFYLIENLELIVSPGCLISYILGNEPKD
jgi:hypothetical protein